MVGENTARLAVLIDADNAQAAITEGLLAEVAKYGTAHVKRAYGDWTGTNLKGWKDQLLAQSIQPIQQFAYTSGKNATDSAMVIDAMDLLYSGRFDGFCIVSSDSDFTRLAARLRESGLTVYGFGERKTPKPFVAACDKFIYIENLTYAESAAAPTGAVPKPTRAPRPRSSRGTPRWSASYGTPSRRRRTTMAGRRSVASGTSSPSSGRTSTPAATATPN